MDDGSVDVDEDEEEEEGLGEGVDKQTLIEMEGWRITKIGIFNTLLTFHLFIFSLQIN